ncbi:MAG: AAA family ATPase, partial [Desulfobacterales bacterium]|nr:AAA family ATPase [Desulfobacterales bacterium]
RLLQNVKIDANRLNILFGPNGGGKSTLLDAIRFVRDCAIKGVDPACAERGTGIDDLWDGAADGANIVIKLETNRAWYEASFGISSGRIASFAGEILLSKKRQTRLIIRETGGENATFYNGRSKKSEEIALREPGKLALGRYLDFDDSFPETREMDALIRSVRFFRSRDMDPHRLKKGGSDSRYHSSLSEGGQNLWAVLQHLQENRERDKRYDTIMGFMKSAFPGFNDLHLERTGPYTVYGGFMETARQKPVRASGASDGCIRMLVWLTALFSGEKDRESLIMFDEPETSLHPHALAVLAGAVKIAGKKWNRQIFIATHSPMLINQFKTGDILAMEINKAGRTSVKRLSEMADIKDLLEGYTAGSLYMAEMIAAQNKLFLDIHD